MTFIPDLAKAYRLRTGDYGSCPNPKRDPLSKDAAAILLGVGMLVFALGWLWILSL